MREPSTLYFHSANAYISRYPLPRHNLERLEKMGYQLSQLLDIVESKPTFRRAAWFLAVTRELQAFKKLREWFFPDYEGISILCRALIARGIATWALESGHIAIDTLPLSLSTNGTISQEMVAVSASGGISLLHTFSIVFVVESFQKGMMDGKESDLEPALRGIVRMSDDLHPCESVICAHCLGAFRYVINGDECVGINDLWRWAPGTPFLTLMRVAAWRAVDPTNNLFISRRRVWHKKLDSLIRRWLQILLECGIDLKAYGKREHSIIFSESLKNDSTTPSVPLVQPLPLFPWVPNEQTDHRGLPSELTYFHLRADFVPCQLWLRNFSYGPKVEDWSMDWDVEMSINLKRFYDVLDKPYRGLQFFARFSEWWDVEENDWEWEDAAEETVVYGPPRMPGGWVEEDSDDSE